MSQGLMFKLNEDPGRPGLRCDGGGLFLGRDALLWRDMDGIFEPRSDADLQRILGRAYGRDANWESRIRSVKLVADALNKGEIARAMITAVLMRLPDPAGAIHAADVHCAVAKAGFNPDEARDERGRWTSGGSDGAYADMDLRQAGTQLADAGMSDVSNDPVAQAAARAEDANTSIVLAAADDEEEKDSRFGIGGNNPPLDELIPRTLIQSPAGPLVQFLDNLLGISEPGDEANLEWAKLQMGALLNKIHEIDPNYVFESIVPEGGLATMSWEGRLNLINGLRADLAAAIYRIQGDIGLLQEVTFAFMQRSANAAYEEAAQLYTAEN